MNQHFGHPGMQRCRGWQEVVCVFHCRKVAPRVTVAAGEVPLATSAGKAIEFPRGHSPLGGFSVLRGCYAESLHVDGSKPPGHRHNPLQSRMLRGAYVTLRVTRSCTSLSTADQAKRMNVTPVTDFCENLMHACAQARMCGVSSDPRYNRYISLFLFSTSLRNQGKQAAGAVTDCESRRSEALHAHPLTCGENVLRPGKLDQSFTIPP